MNWLLVYRVIVISNTDCNKIKQSSLEKTLEEAIKISKKRELPIFIYFTADGCRSCVKMDRTVFPDSIVMNFIKQNFICAKSHWKRLPSKEGYITKEEMELNSPIDDIMQLYEVNGTPSFVVIDSEGSLLHKKIGFMNPKQLVQFGRDALGDENNYTAIEKKINDGEFSFENAIFLVSKP